MVCVDDLIYNLIEHMSLECDFYKKHDLQHVIHTLWNGHYQHSYQYPWQYIKLLK